MNNDTPEGIFNNTIPVDSLTTVELEWYNKTLEESREIYKETLQRWIENYCMRVGIDPKALILAFQDNNHDAIVSDAIPEPNFIVEKKNDDTERN